MALKTACSQSSQFLARTIGLVWFGLVWFGLVWFGLVWFGLVWFGLVWFVYELRLVSPAGPVASHGTGA